MSNLKQSLKVAGYQSTSYQTVDLIEEAVLRKARQSFWAFRQYINPKMKKGWWNRTLSISLQAFYEDWMAGKRPKLVIQAPPQHGKSSLTVDFIAWVAGKNPDCKTIYGSFSQRLGVRANLKLQRMYDSEKYRKLFPGTQINTSNVVSISSQYLRNREILEYVDREGYFRNTTVMGSITGESLDLGVIDDPIKGRAEANSETLRDKTWSWFTDDFATRFSDGAALLIILTRWHLDDPVGRLLREDTGVKVISYPAIAEVDEEFRKKGEPLFPEHKSLEFLLEKKKWMTEPSWEALYQQNPIISDGNIFKPSAVNIIDIAPANIRWIRAWDFASVADGGDYTVGAKLGVQPNGRYVIGHVRRLQGAPHEVEAALVSTARLDSSSVRISIPQDPGQAGKSQVAYFTKQLAGYSVSSSPESGDKVTRAEPFASQVNAGNVDMVRGEWNDAVIDEMLVFPNGKNDDQIDALSRAFGELIVNTFGVLDYYREEYELMQAGKKGG